LSSFRRGNVAALETRGSQSLRKSGLCRPSGLPVCEYINRNLGRNPFVNQVFVVIAITRNKQELERLSQSLRKSGLCRLQ